MRLLCAIGRQFGREIVVFDAVQREEMLAIYSHRDEPNEKDRVRVPPRRFPSQCRREGNYAPPVTPTLSLGVYGRANRPTYHGNPDLTYSHVMWHLGLPKR